MLGCVIVSVQVVGGWKEVRVSVVAELSYSMSKKAAERRNSVVEVVQEVQIEV